MNTKDAIRYTLIDLMESNETTGNELAKAVGVSKQSVSAWRTGKSSIDIENVPAICKFFGITIDEFFGIAKEKKPMQSTPSISPAERELLSLWRRMDARQQGRIIEEMRDYAIANDAKKESADRDGDVAGVAVS